MPPYVHRTTLRFRDTDAAGIIYFASYFTLAHEALEACMVHYDLGVGRVLREKDYILPLVHAEGDFFGSLRVDDDVVIAVTASKIGNTSFTISFDIRNAHATPMATAQTIHVALHKESQRPVHLPEEVREILEAIREA